LFRHLFSPCFLVGRAFPLPLATKGLFLLQQYITLYRAGSIPQILGRPRFTLPRYWGDEKRAAADGTQYELAEENLLAEKHIRYGGFGGIAYHHVSDLYILLFGHFVACGTWEAIYILDILMRNQSTIKPTTLHADTQGQNLPVFGLSYLLGVELMQLIPK